MDEQRLDAFLVGLNVLELQLLRQKINKKLVEHGFLETTEGS